MKGQDTTHSERRVTQPTARSEPGPGDTPVSTRCPCQPVPAGRAPSDPRGQEPELPGPAAHAPAGRSPAEARGGTGARRSAEAWRGRCHPPPRAGPAAAVRGGPGSRDRRDGRAARLRGSLGSRTPKESASPAGAAGPPPTTRLTGISTART